MANGFTQPKTVLDYEPVSKAIVSSQKILILLSQNPSLDSVAAGLSLYLSLKKQQKKVIIACPAPMTVNFNRLYAVDKITQEIGNKNLVISFPCSEDSLEKVSYNIDNQTFSLIIERKDEFPPISKKDVVYNYTGVKSDLVLIVGVNRIEDLGQLYRDEMSFFADAQVVNINSSPAAIVYGKLNIVDSQASSNAELVAQLLKDTQLPVDQDTATNLVAGIEAGTNNLAMKTGAKTFELLAWLMAVGGRRGHLGLNPASQPMNYGQPAGWYGGQPPFAATLSQPVSPRPVSQPAPQQPVSYNQPPFNSQPNRVSPAANGPAPINEQLPDNTHEQNEIPNQVPQPDWFKPKIFKGKTKV
jgi:nanoRNase/pAp phosphatase (c-di-AMP/oligoRNAs hydrolase)